MLVTNIDACDQSDACPRLHFLGALQFGVSLLKSQYCNLGFLRIVGHLVIQEFRENYTSSFEP